MYVGQVITIYQSFVGTNIRCSTEVKFSFILFYMDNFLRCDVNVWYTLFPLLYVHPHPLHFYFVPFPGKRKDAIVKEKVW